MARRPKPMMLNKKLVLNRYILSLFGAEAFHDLAAINRSENEGLDAENISHFYHALNNALGADAALNDNTLQAYDANIVARTKDIQGKRPEPLRWKYFQYLALLFSEIYLHRYFGRREELLEGLNGFLATFNAGMPPKEKLPAFDEDDLRRIAFWSATGSGKTLIMHVNIKQAQHYLSKYGHRRDFNRILLVTPNEGLSHQHLAEMQNSGIAAEIFSKGKTTMFKGRTVEIIDIHKLGDRDGEKTVAVDSFEQNNFVLIDEGHRGSSGDVWGKYRRSLAREGFAIEYSATLGQAAAGNKDLAQRYAKSILFDYSYRHFYGDGYGKDFRIFNLPDADEDNTKEMYLTACMLAFYQQKRLFGDGAAEAQKFNIENPLCVFVGSSVNAVRTRREEKVSDVVDVLLFLARLADPANKADVIARIEQIKTGVHHLIDAEGNNVFQNMFSHIATELQANEIYDDLLQKVFNASAGAALHLDELKGADGEIALRLGTNEDFGVINVGDASKLCSICAEHDALEVSTRNFTGSLFHSINKPESNLHILMGSKRFTEGWNSWRVSTMGLMNVGRNEGSQVIQLFGRGVRLRGLGGCLKRHLEVAKKNDKLAMLETLNIFGVHADYMEQFKRYLEDEGVPTSGPEIITLPVKKMLGDAKLKTIKIKDGYSFAKDGGKLNLKREEDEHLNSVRLDCYPKIESKASEGVPGTTSHIGKNTGKLGAKHLAMLDYDALFFDLQHLKKQRGWFHMCISKENIKTILEKGGWYELYIPEDQLELKDFGRTRLWQEIASLLLQKYCEQFYKSRKSKWETGYREYAVLNEDDPNFVDQYEIRVSKEQKQIIADIRQAIKNMSGRFDGVQGQIIGFDRHLYKPLVYAAGENVRVIPQPLNKGEGKFVRELEEHWEKNSSRFGSKKLYLLRNMSRGHGIGFFEAGNFYPDFIMWLVEGEEQQIIFIDPKGLARTFPGDKKINFYEEIKEIECKMGDSNIKLRSVIISITPFETVKKNFGGKSKEDLNDMNIIFDKDADFIDQLFNTLSST